MLLYHGQLLLAGKQQAENIAQNSYLRGLWELSILLLVLPDGFRQTEQIQHPTCGGLLCDESEEMQTVETVHEYYPATKQTILNLTIILFGMSGNPVLPEPIKV